ncbi:hypothetical protein FOA52_004799 [Chlamydomonas sp. UWO 241]|nr:hypothetical protein FOA52_004799 [Chlamydomonas sp. UWO 241]
MACASSQLEVVSLLSYAIVDHVAILEDAAIDAAVGGKEHVGGSRRCGSKEELSLLLGQLPEFHTKAGGSSANVARALAAGFGVNVGLIAARGCDEWGALFAASLVRAKVNVDRVRKMDTATGRSVILTSASDGERTMRTFMAADGAITADMLRDDDFAGAQWAFLSGYALYQPGLLRAAALRAKEQSVKVMLDLASWEIVREHHAALMGVLRDGLVACCVCNEDEARELLKPGENGGSEVPGAHAVVRMLLQHCETGVVTCASKGCVVGSRRFGAVEVHAEPAIKVDAIDTTGAGDTFSSGFLYGLLRGLPLARCAAIACRAGAAAVRVVGVDLSPSDWQWMHRFLHSPIAASVVDTVPTEVYKELLDAYSLIARIGVGCVYFGSARLGRDSPFWDLSSDLSRDVALLLGSPTWTGGGPGMMRAASEGALQAGLPVGGIRIGLEAGQPGSHVSTGSEALQTEMTEIAKGDYLPDGCSYLCKHMPTRKAALADAGVRHTADQRTAFIFLPGGLGTMDELFSILTLVQLKKLNTRLPVPMLIMDYLGFYDGLFGLLQKFDENRVLTKKELDGLTVVKSNEEALAYLAQFYVVERQQASAGGHGKRKHEDA